MNKLIIAVFLLLATSLTAQEGEDWSRLRAAQRAFLTERLELTPSEADAFFPVYWEEEAGVREDRRSARQNTLDDRRGNMTEAAARRLLEARRQLREQKLSRQTAAEERYLKIIPASKLILLEKAETDFRRQLVERIRRRRN